MKNPTSGDLSVMLNSVIAAQNGHTFIYRGKETHSTGNPLAHTVLRGATNKHGNAIPNYHYEDLEPAAGQVRADRPEKSGCHRRYQPLQLQQKIRTADPHHPGGTAKPPLRSTDLCPGKGPHDRKLSGARSPEDRLRPAHLRQIHHRSLPGRGGIRAADLRDSGTVLRVHSIPSSRGRHYKKPLLIQKDRCFNRSGPS